ncbi:MAG: hypothetical protein J6Z18_08525 [Prevotella sp.]|nr:hypothetical protein [Prevotella sp.]
MKTTVQSLTMSIPFFGIMMRKRGVSIVFPPPIYDRLLHNLITILVSLI